MPITDADLFRIVERWAVGSAEGFVAGRNPAEDQVALQELVSKLTWPIYPGVEPPHLPRLAPVEGSSTMGGEEATVGPFRGALSFKLPPVLAKWFGVAPDSGGAAQTSRVVSVEGPEAISVRDFPTCTQKGIFKVLQPGEHPAHPVLDFHRPVDRVHVRLSDDRDRLLWDATYKMGGKTSLDNTVKEAIPGESQVPDYIPACALEKTMGLKLQVDSEYLNKPLEIKFLNPTGIEDEGPVVHAQQMNVHRPGGSHLPQHEVERADAVVCKVTKQDPAKEKALVDLDASAGKGVFLPDTYKEALWRVDRLREETSDLNPHGVPMREFLVSSKKGQVVLSRDKFNVQEPVGIGKYHMQPRRPEMAGEIRVDQLERGNMRAFDARKMPQNIHIVDKYAIVEKDDMFHQPTVKRTVFGPMWQGIHDKETPLHPSIQFKHPANVAHVRLVDKSDKNRLLWDAVFDVKGNHKIAADQKPIGGEKPKFIGLDPPTRKGHLYSLSVEADNPATLLPGEKVRLIDFWRKSEFLFGASRPTTHNDIRIEVSQPGLASLMLSKVLHS